MIRMLFSRRWLATSCLVLAAAAVCVRLGTWQLDRLETRRTFNNHVRAMQALPALELPSQETVLDQEYREARAEGTYDFGHQIAIRNQAQAGIYGFHLLTPLNLDAASGLASGAGQHVMVDRGWIPAEGNEAPKDWRKYDVEGIVQVNGVIRLGQLAPSFGGISQPAPGPDQPWLDFWMYVDLVSIGSQMPYPILPVYVQQAASSADSTPPVAVLPAIDLGEGPHLGYAGQWFTFSGLLILGYPFYVRRRESNPS